MSCSEKELEKLLAAYAEHSHSSAVLFGPFSRPTARNPKPHIPKSGKHLLSRHSHLSRVLQRQSRVSRSHSPHPSASQLASPSLTTSTDSRALYDGYGETMELATGSPPPYDFKKYSEKLPEAGYLSSSGQVSRGSTGEGVGREMGRERLPPRSPDRQDRRMGVVGEERSGRVVRGRRLLRRTLSNQSLQSVSSNTSGELSTQRGFESAICLCVHLYVSILLKVIIFGCFSVQTRQSLLQSIGHIQTSSSECLYLH